MLIGTLRNGFRGKMAEIIADETPEICIEGSRMCGKTTGTLFKVVDDCDRNPGKWWYVGRYSSSDNDTKLRPDLERIFESELPADKRPSWDTREKCYRLHNDARIYSYGLKAQDQQSRYSKVRGMAMGGILVSQAEELPKDVGEELRAGLRQKGQRHQLLLEANPPDDNFWMADQFPIDNSTEGRRHYSISLYENAHNLPEESIANLERSYPPTHAKYRTLILGLRGVNVTGEPVYGEIFRRHIHGRALKHDPSLPLIEAFEHGKTHPLWLIAQRPYAGGMHVLGGVCGQRMFFGEFLRIVKEYRAQWFPDAEFKTCCPPSAGGKVESRIDTARLLRRAQFSPRCVKDAKPHDVRLMLIETIAAHMQTRNPDHSEAFAVNSDRSRWVRATRKGPQPWEFISDGCEAGYAWDEHMISVGNREVRKPKADDWFELGMMALENLELNFGTDQPSRADLDKRQRKARQDRYESEQYPQGPAGWMGV